MGDSDEMDSIEGSLGHDISNFERANKQRTRDQECAIIQNEACIQQFVDKINSSTECKNIGIHFGPCKMFKGKLEPNKLNRLVTYRLDGKNKLTHSRKRKCQSLKNDLRIFESANFVLHRANIAMTLIHASAQYVAKDKSFATEAALERKIAEHFNRHELSHKLNFYVQRQEPVPKGRLDLFIEIKSQKGSDLRRQSQKPQIYNIIVELKLLEDKKYEVTPPTKLMEEMDNVWYYAEAMMEGGYYPVGAMFIYQVPRDTNQGRSASTVAGVYWGCGTLLYGEYVAEFCNEPKQDMRHLLDNASCQQQPSDRSHRASPHHRLATERLQKDDEMIPRPKQSDTGTKGREPRKPER